MHLSCVEELNIEEKTEDTIGHKDFKCLASCKMTKKGFLKKGILDVQAVTEAVNNHNEIDEELKTLIIADIPKCAEYIKDKDQCDKALSFTHCLSISISFHAGRLRESISKEIS